MVNFDSPLMNLKVALLTTDWEFRHRFRPLLARLRVGSITTFTGEEHITLLKALTTGNVNLIFANVAEASGDLIAHIANKFHVPIFLVGSESQVSSFLATSFEESGIADQVLQISTDQADWDIEAQVRRMFEEVSAKLLHSDDSKAEQDTGSAIGGSILGAAVLVGAFTMSVTQALPDGLNGAQGFLVGALTAFGVLLVVRGMLKLAVVFRRTTDTSQSVKGAVQVIPSGISVTAVRVAREETK